METADVTLMRGDLRSVPQAIKLSKATMRNIRENLTWAFGYNVALIPIAAGVSGPVCLGAGVPAPVASDPGGGGDGLLQYQRGEQRAAAAARKVVKNQTAKAQSTQRKSKSKKNKGKNRRHEDRTTGGAPRQDVYGLLIFLLLFFAFLPFWYYPVLVDTQLRGNGWVDTDTAGRGWL